MLPTPASVGPIDRDRLALAERTVPRYTSYPPAPHFQAGIGPDICTQWLGELDPAATLSLYIHVPFCASMCAYCGCHTKVVRRQEPIDAYRARLVREVGIIAARTRARHVTRIHWGGGTPTMLSADGMAELVATIANRFDLTSLIEHAVELDPRQLTSEMAHKLATLGVTRASLGVQDLNEHVQVAIGRLQPLEQVSRAVAWLREAGITRLNFDLMYGLPHQSVGDLVRTVEAVTRLVPDRIALFGYAHVPWFKTHQRLIDEAALPGTAVRLEQAETARAALAGAGYVAIGLDHFARCGDPLVDALRAGRLKRNFQGYTDDDAEALIGFGASAIGRLPRGYVQNAVDFGGYHRAIDAGRPATTRGHALSPDDRLRGEVIERLMGAGEVALDEVARTHGASPSQLVHDARRLAPLVELGLVESDGARVRITASGLPYARLVAVAFDAYASPLSGVATATRHARAV